MAKKIKGVTCIKRKGTIYWYARVDGRRVCCGKGDKGYRLAVKARQKYEVKQYENREINAGMEVKRAQFKTVRQLSNWYYQLPVVQKQKSYDRKVIASTHLLRHLGAKSLGAVDSDLLERYREKRNSEKIQNGTIDFELGVLSAMYHLAKKRKKIQGDLMPGEFPLCVKRIHVGS